jgi:hypothetical protein
MKNGKSVDPKIESHPNAHTLIAQNDDVPTLVDLKYPPSVPFDVEM